MAAPRCAISAEATRQCAASDGHTGRYSEQAGHATKTGTNTLSADASGGRPAWAGSTTPSLSCVAVRRGALTLTVRRGGGANPLPPRLLPLAAAPPADTTEGVGDAGEDSLAATVAAATPPRLRRHRALHGKGDKRRGEPAQCGRPPLTPDSAAPRDQAPLRPPSGHGISTGRLAIIHVNWAGGGCRPVAALETQGRQ